MLYIDNGLRPPCYFEKELFLSQRNLEWIFKKANRMDIISIDGFEGMIHSIKHIRKHNEYFWATVKILLK